ncbi:uncharacterized protein LOC117301365 [Asterias rubens]|uniref:uncharacterized protein LOC117301281 n=1 Tax=Asterias rubens TaxID=7604 RepID=UPI0014559DE2|nr:uncharacterized protein LOC117301281 [Asterias rubens]XP_033641187.1 uncharacterized protein LOC117301365 [Asterias rubens]
MIQTYRKNSGMECCKAEPMFRRVRYNLLTYPGAGWIAFVITLFLWALSVPYLRQAPSGVVPDTKEVRLQMPRAAAEKAFRRNTETMYDIRYNTSEYSHSFPVDDTCFFTRKLSKSDMPTIHSIFSNPASQSVVFVGVRFLRDNWAEDKFICEFENGERTQSDPIVNDYRSFGYLAQYVFVLTCPLPEIYIGRTNFTMSFYKVTWRPKWYMFAYANLTVCRAGSWPLTKKHFLSVCTMVKDMDEFLPDWLDYHRFMGVEHAYIYDNAVEKMSLLRETVKEDVDSGFVTVIPWSHRPSAGKSYLEVQIAHENDCLWRHRYDTHWMMKIDVDEYVQPMNPANPKIPNFLRDPRLNKLGAIRLQNWFFGRPNTSEVLEGSIMERNRWRPSEPTLQNTGRDKNILRPINVHYFKIHAIKLGGETKSINPETEMRLVHYRGDNPRVRHFDLPEFDVLDESMVNIWKQIKKAKMETSLEAASETDNEIILKFIEDDVKSP